MHRTAKLAFLAGVTGLSLVACNTERLVIPNYSNPSTESVKADPAAAIPLLANGVLRNDRDIFPGYVLGTAILGREAYNYTPTEGRNTSGWLVDVGNQASFGGVSLWAGPYNALRNIANLLEVVQAAPAGLVTPAQLSATNGFAKTMEALELNYIVQTRDDLGAPVEMSKSPADLSPFVSRDSVYGRIIGRLNGGAADLAAGGTSFPFTLHSGYAGFTTPTTYRQFNRALAARVNAYRASRQIAGCAGAARTACYTEVLTNLSQSFLNENAVTVAAMEAGVRNVYSQAAGDVANSISNAATSHVVAHARVDSGVQTQVGGAPDARWTRKVMTIAQKNPANATLGIPTTYDWSIYLTRTDPIPIIKNEELILLRAEARYYTGDIAGAVADLNRVRTVSGGLAPITAANIATESAFLDELLYNRRWSLAFEGHRWIDMRRFGRLTLLTRDLANHIVVSRLPIPQAECLVRAGKTGALAGPGCS